MKLLYFDLGMGASGDMLTAALFELLPDRSAFLDKLNSIGLHDVVFAAEPSEKCGITGTHISVLISGTEEGAADSHEHAHDHIHTHNQTDLTDVEHIISHLDVSEKVKKDVVAIYNIIAAAESHVHGRPVAEIHFHELGSMDAIADVTAVCMLMEKLAPEKIVASPVHTGSGHVHCDHGVLPVPAPATAYILQGIPNYGGSVKGELCTPTGAALLKYFVDEFGDQPVLRTEAIGYGMGMKDFETANCLRAMIGDTEDRSEVIYELSCNIDDMTGEQVGYAMDRLFAAGARDVYTIPIGMKKNRPGILLRAMCTEETRQDILKAIFRYTTTLGVRETETRRYALARDIESVETPFGPVRRKISSGFGVKRSKLEYDDLSRIASEEDMTLEEIARIIGDEM